MEKSGGAGQQVGRRDPDLVEDDVRVLHDAQADLVGDLRCGVARTVRLHDEALDVLVSDVPGPNEGEVRDGAGADPTLGAVEDPLVAVQPRGGFQAAGDVRAVVRLRQGERPELGERGEAREPARLLFLRAELVDHADDQLVVDPDERREGHVGARHLDIHEPLEELGRAVRLQPAQTVFAEFGEQPEGKLLAVPVVDRCGPDPGLQEFPDLLVAELFVRRQQVHDVHEVGVGKRRLRRGFGGGARSSGFGFVSDPAVFSVCASALFDSALSSALFSAGADGPLARPCGCTGTYPFVMQRLQSSAALPNPWMS